MSSQFSPQAFSEISVEEFAQRRTDEPDLQLIDVREPQEIEVAYVEGFEVLPLSQFADWSEDIQTRFDPQKETIVLCHHGMRSAQMCQWLTNQGFTNVKNLVGGIDAYSAIVDPAVPRY